MNRYSVCSAVNRRRLLHVQVRGCGNWGYKPTVVTWPWLGNLVKLVYLRSYSCQWSPFPPKMIHCGEMCAAICGKMLWVTWGGREVVGVQTMHGNATLHAVCSGRTVAPKLVTLSRKQQRWILPKIIICGIKLCDSGEIFEKRCQAEL